MRSGATNGGQAPIPAPAGPLSCLPASCSRLLATRSSPPFSGMAGDAGSPDEGRTTACLACAYALCEAPKGDARARSCPPGSGIASSARLTRPRQPASFPSPFASSQCISRNMAATIQKLASASAQRSQAAGDNHFAPTFLLGPAASTSLETPLRGLVHARCARAFTRGGPSRPKRLLRRTPQLPTHRCQEIA